MTTQPNLPPEFIEERDEDTGKVLGRWVVANWPTITENSTVLCSTFNTLQKGDMIMLKAIYENGVFMFPCLTEAFQSNRNGMTHSLTTESFQPEKSEEYRGTVMKVFKHHHQDTMSFKNKEWWQHNGSYYMLDAVIYGGKTLYHVRLRSQDALSVVNNKDEQTTSWYLNLVVYKWVPAVAVTSSC